MDSDSDLDKVLYGESWIREHVLLSKGDQKARAVRLESFDQTDLISLSSSSDSESEIEEEIRIRFVSDFNRVARLKILPSDNFSSIFEQISKSKNVPVERIEIVMCPEMRIVSQYDTLTSLKFNSCYLFDVVIKDSNFLVSRSNGIGNIEVKCIGPDKSLKTYKMDDNQPLDILMTYCSRDFSREKNDFKLLFDGEIIKPDNTCKTLGISNLDIIEIHFISS